MRQAWDPCPRLQDTEPGSQPGLRSETLCQRAGDVPHGRTPPAGGGWWNVVHGRTQPAGGRM